MEVEYSCRAVECHKDIKAYPIYLNRMFPHLHEVKRCIEKASTVSGRHDNYQNLTDRFFHIYRSAELLNDIHLENSLYDLCHDSCFQNSIQTWTWS